MEIQLNKWNWNKHRTVTIPLRSSPHLSSFPWCGYKTCSRPNRWHGREGLLGFFGAEALHGALLILRCRRRKKLRLACEGREVWSKVWWCIMWYSRGFQIMSKYTMIFEVKLFGNQRWALNSFWSNSWKRQWTLKFPGRVSKFYLVSTISVRTRHYMRTPSSLPSSFASSSCTQEQFTFATWCAKRCGKRRFVQETTPQFHWM